MNLLRWLLAQFMTRWIRWVVRPRLWTRTTAWDPTRCNECGWRGPLRWCYHGYQDDGSGEDVVARDECPRCYSDDLDTSF